MSGASTPAPSTGRAIAKFGVVIAAAGFVGKLLALVREALIGSAFGAGSATDALFLALSVPVTLSSIVGGGGLRVAFLPELTRRLTLPDPASASRYTTMVLGAVALGGFVGAIALAGGAGPLASFAHFSGSTEELSRLLRLLAPMLPLLVLMDLYAGYLHAKLHFGWPALEAAIRNGVIIISVGLFAAIGVDSLAYGHLIGTAFVTLACFLAARGLGLRVIGPGADEWTALKSLLVTAGPAIVGSSIHPAMTLIDRVMGGWLGPGIASALSYADPLWQVGLFVAAPVSVVAFPVLAKLAVDGDETAFAEAVRKTVRGSLLLTAPLAALLSALAVPAVQLLYLRGKFDASAAELTAQATMFYALCLPPIAAQGVTLRALQARRQFMTSGAIGIIVVVAHAAMNVPLMYLMGHRGIPLSAALAAGLLVVLLDRRLALPAPGRWLFLAKLSAGSLACYAVARLTGDAVPELSSPIVTTLARLAAGGLAGAAAYVVTMWAVRCAEAFEMAKGLRSRA